MEGVLGDEILTPEDFLALEAVLQQAEARNSVSGAEIQGAKPDDVSCSGVFAEEGLSDVRRTLAEDIEDVGAVIDRRRARRRRGLFVTDISSSEWCQQKAAFALSTKLPQEQTPAMMAGTQQHAQLEAETALESVVVNTESAEDRFAVRLLNMVQGLRQLLQQGITREFAIFGSVQGCWIWGIIDQMELDDNGVVRIVEHKTRFQPSTPSAAQKRTTALQLMLYWRMFTQLQDTFAPANAAAAFKDWHLDPHKALGPDIQAHANACHSEAADLASIAVRLHDTACAVPTCRDTMRVDYIWQGDGQLLDQDTVKYDPEVFEPALARHLGFWMGAAPPARVPDQEIWKCNKCIFRPKCRPELIRQVPWQH